MKKFFKLIMLVSVAVTTIVSVTLITLKVFDIINPMAVKKYIPIFGEDNMPID